MHAASVLIGDMWYISGGNDERAQPNGGMFAIDLKEMNLVTCSGTFAPRYGHAMVANDEGELFIVGGLKRSNLAYAEIIKYENENWAFYAKPDDFTWNGFARAYVFKNVLYSFGGIPNMQLIGIQNTMQHVHEISDDVLMHLLSYCGRRELNALILTSKSYKVCAKASRMITIWSILF